MTPSRLLAVSFFGSSLLLGCGGESKSVGADGTTGGAAGDATTGGVAGSDAGRGGSGATGGAAPEGGSAGVAGNGAGTGGTAVAGGSGGTATAGVGGTAGAGPYDFPDRFAEPPYCAPGDTRVVLPEESVGCVVEDRVGNTRVRWDYDASTRTLTETGNRADGTTWDLYWTYSSDGRAARYGTTTDNMFVFYYQYDEYGALVRITSNLNPEIVIEPTYDAGGVLIRETVVESPATLTSRAYVYNDQGWLFSEELDVEVDGTVESLTTFTYVRNCSLDLLEQQGSYHGWMDGVVVVRNHHFYDDAGRLIRRESDGGGFFDTPADGVTDEFKRWTYAPDGSVATFERDGTADDVGGPPDGVADESLAFSPACTLLAPISRELFHFPN